VITAQLLDQTPIPPLQWVVPGLVPEGSGLLAAAPKEGKSWLVFTLALAAATGSKFLGVQLERRPVLYLALEDGHRRLQERQRRILGEEPAPDNLLLKIDGADALDAAKRFVLDRPGQLPLVIVDTLARVRPPRDPRSNAYLADYEFAAKLKEIADLRATVLGVHHTRKQASEDFLESASGTNGLTGAVDFVMVLQRERNQPSAILNLTGRDVAEARYSLIFEDGLWKANGADLTEAAQHALNRRLGDTKRAVLAFVQGRAETRAGDITAALGLSDSSARQTLSRLSDDGLVGKQGRGVYTSVTMSQTEQNTRSERDRL
jgi:RecA-family ATPase